jgi:DNA polymerase elongation subunit (family B)
MGKTVESYRMALEAEIHRWSGFEKVLRTEDRQAFEELKLIDGEVPIEDLTITKHLSKNPKHYKQHASQVIAAEQLIKEGSEVHAGNNVHFVFTDSNNKRFDRGVKAEQLLDKGVNPDERKYLQLLYASAASLLSFSNYTVKTVQDSIKGYENKNLCNYFCTDPSL